MSRHSAAVVGSGDARVSFKLKIIKNKLSRICSKENTVYLTPSLTLTLARAVARALLLTESHTPHTHAHTPPARAVHDSRIAPPLALTLDTIAIRFVFSHDAIHTHRLPIRNPIHIFSNPTPRRGRVRHRRARSNSHERLFSPINLGRTDRDFYRSIDRSRVPGVRRGRGRRRFDGS